MCAADEQQRLRAISTTLGIGISGEVVLVQETHGDPDPAVDQNLIPSKSRNALKLYYSRGVPKWWGRTCLKSDQPKKHGVSENSSSWDLFAMCASRKIPNVANS